MANLKIEERVVIAAPVDAVWRFLLDPERVVQCLPGAAYDSKESDNVFLGHMKVKVGPVTTLFAGKATMSEIDEVARSLRITGEGKDKNGAGTAKMVMLGKVTEVPGGAELSIDAEVDIAGKLVTFGRGLIKSVSAQLFKQFSARAQELLTEPAADSSQAVPEAAIEGAGEAAIEGAEPSAEAPAQASAEAPAQASAEAGELGLDGGARSKASAATGADAGAAPSGGDEPSAKAAASSSAGAAASSSSAGAAAASSSAGAAAAAAHHAKTPPGAARLAPARALAKKPAQEESLNALSLVFKALAASIANFFRRLFGAKVK